MKEKLSAVRWRRVSLAIATGLILILAAATVYDAWRKRNGWCVLFYPDGSQKIFYGDDCEK